MGIGGRRTARLDALALALVLPRGSKYSRLKICAPCRSDLDHARPAAAFGKCTKVVETAVLSPRVCVAAITLGSCKLWTRTAGASECEPSGVTPTTSLVAMLSHGLWQTRFGSDPTIIGRSIVLNAVAPRFAPAAPSLGLNARPHTGATPSASNNPGVTDPP
jgi:hypothetical protein